MTYKQLKKDVMRLGFETVVEDEEALLGAANSALELIYLDRPRVRTARLYITPIPLKSRITKIVLTGEELTIPIEGDSYSFTTIGRGSYTVTDDNGSVKNDLSLDRLMHRGRVNGGAKITLRSDGTLTVFDLCFFDGISEDEDIPLYSALREVDVTEGRGDLRSFSKMPADAYGSPVKCAVLHGERLLLPWDFEGEVFIDYYRSPTPIRKDNDEEDIDISVEMSPLLPLLTASFLWLDDDSDKAQYYMAMYRQSLATIMRYSLRTVNSKYETNGWG